MVSTPITKRSGVLLIIISLFIILLAAYRWSSGKKTRAGVASCTSGSLSAQLAIAKGNGGILLDCNGICSARYQMSSSSLNAMQSFSSLAASHSSSILSDTAQQMQLGRASALYLLECNSGCGPHSRCFLGKCFCLPGWAGKTCSERHVFPLVDADLCPVLESLEEVTHSFIAPYLEYTTRCRAEGPLHTAEDCAIMCFWQADAGIVQVSKQVWRMISDIEFGLWKGMEEFSSLDRDEEHEEGFNAFSAVPGLALGNLLEIGAGPYTQTKNLLKNRPDLTVHRIYLAEPNIYRYTSLENCAYRDGTLLGHPVNLLSLPVEELPAFEFFDTVIQVNVIEHVYNAFDFLTAVYRSLRPGGTLIFHERYFDDPVGGDSAVLGTLLIHPMRVKRDVLLHLFRLFEPIYVKPMPTTASKSRNVGENGYYFIGKKRENPLPENEPDMELFTKKFPEPKSRKND